MSAPVPFRVGPTAVLPGRKPGAVPTPAVEAITTLAEAYARPLRVGLEPAEDVVVDGAGPPLPRGPLQAIVLPRILVLGANVAPSLGRPTRRVPGRSTRAAASLVVGLVLAAAVPAALPVGARLPVQAADAASARPIVAEQLAGVEGQPLPSVVATSLVAPLLPSPTPSRVPVGLHVAPRLTKLPVAVARRGQLEAAKRLVPRAAGAVPTKDHAVAHADAAERAVRVAVATVLGDF